MRITAVALSVVFLASSVSLSAQTAVHDQALPALDDVLPSLSPEDRGNLISGGEYLRFQGDGMSPGLLPDTGLTAAVARQIISGDLNIGLEGLFFTPVETLPGSYTAMPADQRTLTLYNILRSVSTLEGLEYYSASRDEMRLLFEESRVIADPDHPKDVLNDPLVHSVPESDSIYIHQKDKTFASNESEMRFLAGSDAFAAAIVNLTPMRYKGILRVVDPGNMQTHLIVIPVREGILVYGTMAAKTLNVKAFLDRAEASFTNRVIALSGWYRDRLVSEFSR